MTDEVAQGTGTPSTPKPTWVVGLLGVVVVALIGVCVFFVMDRTKAVEVGDEGKIGQLVITVSGPAQRLEMVGAGTPPLGSTYVVIAVTVGNDSQTEASFDSKQALLVRNDGTRESVDEEAMQRAAGILSDNPLAGALELGIGASTAGQLVYVAPIATVRDATLLVMTPDRQQSLSFDIGIH